MATANFCLTVALVEGLKGEDTSLVLFGVGIYVLLLALAFFSRHRRRRPARCSTLSEEKLAPAVGRKGQMQGTCVAECPQEIATAYLRQLSRLSFGFLAGC